MKLLISFLISIFLLSSNLYSSENTRENVIKLNDNTQLVKPKISEEQFRELIRKLPNKENIRDTYKETSNDFMEFVKKLRPLLVPAIIIIWLMSRSSNKSEDKPKQNKKNKSVRSRTEEFIKHHNESHNKDENKETENDKSYEDEWNYDQEEIPNLRIKIEEQQVEDSKVYDVEAFGILGFTQEQIDQTKIENEEAKFTCYVFDVTDKNNEIALQGLTDPFRDDKFLLQSSRNMKVGLGYAYNSWTPMFRFPVSLVIPPNRGKTKIKISSKCYKIKC